jgi:Fe-S cluster assembly protein SufD
MTQLAENKSVHLSQYLRLLDGARSGGSGGGGAGGNAFMRGLRQSGIERFDAVGFPTTTQEEWRFTNVTPIARVPFTLAEPAGGEEAAEIAGRYSLGADASAEIVIVNGHYSPSLSRASRSLRVTVTGLAAGLEHHGRLIEPYLAKYARIEKNPFVALNTGFLHDGVFVHVARAAAVEKPIHLLFVSTGGSTPAVSHPRTLIVVEEGAQASIVESYVGGESGVYWTNAVTEIVAGAGAVVDHCRIQQESFDAFHVATMEVNLAEQSCFVSHAATLGAALSRNDLNVTMGGRGAEATLNGLVILSGRQHADNHTLLDHAQPNCPSHELYKHLLDGKSSCVFKGKIFVRPDAQKTDSKQTSKSLLLSDEASMNSQPALEIYADDVKCTHGSTTGPVDEEMVFYLRSRGVGMEAARHLLAYAFAADITRRIRVAPVRERLEDLLAARHGLPRDLRITDLGTHDEKAR